MTDINNTMEVHNTDILQDTSTKENISQNTSAAEENISLPHTKGTLPFKLKTILHNRKRVFSISLIFIILIPTIIIGMSWLTNNYTTPIKVMQKYANAEEFTLQKYILDNEGGLARNQIKQIMNVLRNSDYFLDLEEEIYDVSVSNYETRLDNYGDNFSITYTILSREELTKSDLRDKRADLQEHVYDLEAIVDETEDFSASDWGELAELFGLLKAETKQLIENISKLSKEYGRIEVSKGYTLSVLITTTGDALAEPLEEEIEINVYKVNGRWIGESFGLTLDILSDLY